MDATPSNLEPNQPPGAVDAAAAEESPPRDDEPMADDAAPAPDGGNATGGANDNDPADEEQQPVDDEPNWQALMEYDPARTEVPSFLAARSRSNAASDRFAVGLDVLHDSVTQSTAGLVDVVSSLLSNRAEKLHEYEEGLKYEYVTNDRARADMHRRLEESARMAQGLFANLLMRVARPDEAPTASDAPMDGGAGNDGESNANGNNDGGVGDDEPDWDAIVQHEPARSEVPLFLAARGRREAACARFESAIHAFESSIEGYVHDLTQAVADLYNNRTMKLDEYEQVLKHGYVENDKARARMQANLEESATAAQSMFGELMMRVMQPGMQGQAGQQQMQMQMQMQPMTAGILTQATTLGDSP